jgi:hypothetical protein
MSKNGGPRRPVLAAAVLVCAVLAAFPAGAQTADGAAGTAVPAAPPTDIVLALDVSGSMAENAVFGDVEGYLKAEVLGSLVKLGDRVTLIAFGSAARTFPTVTVATEADRLALADRLAALKPDSDFTDLGAALEALDAALADRNGADYKPLAIFITDGKHAPPPGSAYAGAAPGVDARFAGIGERIAKKGWFVYVVGLGEKTDAPAIAEAVPGAVLATGAEALAAAPLEAFDAAASAAVADRAETAAAERAAADAAAAAAVPAPDEDGGLADVVVPLAIAAAAIGLIVLIVAAARRRKDKA